jgi:hypothetical protein
MDINMDINIDTASMPNTCRTHARHMQDTCRTHARHMQVLNKTIQNYTFLQNLTKPYEAVQNSTFTKNTKIC